MTRYESNAAVKAGYYFNPSSMKVVPVARDGERLPDEKGAWLSVPTFLALALTPILGALFLMFLPVIGFVLFGNALVKKLAGGVKAGAEELSVNVTPGWAPGAAHLTGREAEEKKAAEAKAPAGIEKLEKEIGEKRK